MASAPLQSTLAAKSIAVSFRFDRFRPVGKVRCHAPCEGITGGVSYADRESAAQ